MAGAARLHRRRALARAADHALRVCRDSISEVAVEFASRRGWHSISARCTYDGGRFSDRCARDWSGIWGDPVKFGLGARDRSLIRISARFTHDGGHFFRTGSTSLVFDVAFMWQHFVAYRGRAPPPPAADASLAFCETVAQPGHSSRGHRNANGGGRTAQPAAPPLAPPLLSPLTTSRSTHQPPERSEGSREKQAKAGGWVGRTPDRTPLLAESPAPVNS